MFKIFKRKKNKDIKQYQDIMKKEHANSRKPHFLILYTPKKYKQTNGKH